jgi:hypothetical protein
MEDPRIVDRSEFVVVGTIAGVVRGTGTPEKVYARLEPLSMDGAYYGTSLPGPKEGGFVEKHPGEGVTRRT